MPTSEPSGLSAPQKTLVTIASIIVIVAGLKQAGAVIVPWLLSLFIAILFAPSLYWLRRHKCPTPLALVVIFLAISTLTLGFSAVFGSSIQRFLSKIPYYEKQLTAKVEGVENWLLENEMLKKLVKKADPQSDPDSTENGTDETEPSGDSKQVNSSQEPDPSRGQPQTEPQDPAPTGEGETRSPLLESLRESLNPGTALGFVGQIFTGISATITNGLLILLTVLFILLEASSIPQKFMVAFKMGPEKLDRMRKMAHDVNRYMAIKTGVSVLTGILIYALVRIVGLDYALLWGLLGFLLNFIPNLGSIIAAVPALLLGLVELSPTGLIALALGYTAINNIVGNFLEPRVMGRGLGLSTLVVFLSLIFWGWVFGPIGMLLSVPLTMSFKIALEANPETRWISVLLGPEAPEVSEGKTA